MTPGKKYIRFGLSGNIIGAQKQTKKTVEHARWRWASRARGFAAGVGWGLRLLLAAEATTLLRLTMPVANTAGMKLMRCVRIMIIDADTIYLVRPMKN